MVLMAAAGAAVLAMVAWVALREAQRMPSSGPPARRAVREPTTAPPPLAPRATNGDGESRSQWRVQGVGDATIPGADTDEALAAAAALWHVLVASERRQDGRPPTIVGVAGPPTE